MTTLHNSLCQLAADNPHLLTAYRDDLFVHDKTSLADAKAADEYVWLLRKCGTALFPLRIGREPIWATFWLDPPEVKAFHVRVAEDGGASGTVRAITHTDVRELVSQPAPARVSGYSITPQPRLA